MCPGTVPTTRASHYKVSTTSAKLFLVEKAGEGPTHHFSILVFHLYEKWPKSSFFRVHTSSERAIVQIAVLYYHMINDSLPHWKIPVEIGWTLPKWNFFGQHFHFRDPSSVDVEFFLAEFVELFQVGQQSHTSDLCSHRTPPVLTLEPRFQHKAYSNGAPGLPQGKIPSHDCVPQKWNQYRPPVEC